MLKSNRFFGYASLVLAVGLASFSSNPTSSLGDMTGSPFSRSTCSSCHGGGSFNPSMEVQLRDLAGNTLNAYRPGELHMLEIRMRSQPTAASYGLQAILLDSLNSQVGTIDSLSSRLRLGQSMGRSYIEHRSPIADSIVQVFWRAPQNSANLPITMYTVLNAVNRNGGTSGDQVRQQSFTWVADRSSSSSERPEVLAKALKYRRAGDCNLEVWIDGAAFAQSEEPYVWQAFDLMGRLVAKTSSQGAETSILDFAGAGPGCNGSLASELLVLQVCQGTQCQSKWVAMFGR